jgi:hypothetical protein
MVILILVLLVVDVSSIDRRDLERQYESTKRVESLVEAFKNSQIHQQTLHNISEAITGNNVRKSKNGNAYSSGPSYLRVLLTLVG